MRLAHCLASIAEEAAGPSASVPGLAAAQAAAGAEVEILTLGRGGGRRFERRFGRWAEGVPGAERLGASPAMARYLRESEHEIVHGHGLWMLPALYAGLVPVPGRLFVISPRGMLADAALRCGTLRKRAFTALVQRRALDAARLWHATCMAEAAEIRAAGFNQPVAIVPNGIALPPPCRRKERREVLALARLHPKKGLDRLVDAWAQVEREETSRGWWLTLAGPDEAGTRARLAAQAARRGLERVRITGPLYGAEKADRLARAAVFALPSLNENFGMAAAEALAAGTPVIASRGTPWSGLEAERCGWWVPGTRDALAWALRAALALPPEARAAMGARGRRWMARDFGWPTQAEALAVAYEWARAGARGTPPPGVLAS